MTTPRALEPYYDSAALPRPFVREAQELLRYRGLVRQWTLRNLRLRYKRSVLGMLWTLLEPLLLTLIIGTVFSQVFRGVLTGFPVYLMAGLLLFDFFSRSTLQMVDEIVASRELVERIYVPRSVFAVASVLTHLTQWCVGWIPLLAMALYFRISWTASLLTVPLGMILMTAFTLGVGLVVSKLGARFHDVKLTFQVLLTAWFYATPIMYPLSLVPEEFQAVLRLNPLYHLCELVRAPVFRGEVAAAPHWWVATALAAAALAIGWWVFTTDSDLGHD